MADNRVYMLRRRVVGDDFESALPFETAPMPQPDAGEVLVRNIYLSLDPANRLWVREQGSYIPPLPLDAPMIGLIIGEVVESRDDSLKPGDIVSGQGQWADYSPAPAAGLTKLDPVPGVPLAAFAGPLGATGWTAYFGLLEIGQPKAGETLLVSAAAGAVGSIVGQIGKIKGCRVIGIAGDDDKAAWLTRELGFDGAVNYRKAEDLSAAIAAACPDGVDIYFENVGQPVFDAVLDNINMNARIPLCGLIAQYNATSPVCNTYKMEQILLQRARIEGFLILDYFDRVAEAIGDLSGWMQAGKLKYRLTIEEGLENTLTAFHKLFAGGNVGKMLVKVGEEPGA